MFGGGFPGFLEIAANALTPGGDHISPANQEERLAIELQQIDELVAFYIANDKQENVAIVCGDFNIDGSDRVKFAEVKARLGAISMTDVLDGGAILKPCLRRPDLPQQRRRRRG